MKSKKGVVLGSGMGTIISTILIIGILIAFTFVSTALKQFGDTEGIFIDEKEVSINSVGKIERDDLGIIAQNSKHQLIEKLERLVKTKHKDYTFLEAAILLNETNSKDFLSIFGHTTIKYPHTEILKEKVSIVCSGGVCIQRESQQEKILEFFDIGGLSHEYVKIELTEAIIIISNIKLEERELKEGPHGESYCIHIGDRKC